MISRIATFPRAAQMPSFCRLQHYPVVARSLVRAYAKASFSKDIPPLELAYDKHPAGESSTKEPIVFLHGLFGSKTNNRSVSK